MAEGSVTEFTAATAGAAALSAFLQAETDKGARPHVQPGDGHLTLVSSKITKILRDLARLSAVH